MGSLTARRRIADLLDSFEYSLAVTVLILFTVFAWDISEGWLPKVWDGRVEMAMTVVFVLFVIELGLMIFASTGLARRVLLDMFHRDGSHGFRAALVYRCPVRSQDCCRHRDSEPSAAQVVQGDGPHRPPAAYHQDTPGRPLQIVLFAPL